MTGIKLMMLGGSEVAPEDPGSVTYSAGYSGAIYEPVGWDTVDLEIAGVVGESGPAHGSGYSTWGLGTMITKDGVDPSLVTLYVATGNNVPGSSPAGTGGAAGVVTHTFYNGGIGGAASAADVNGTASVASGGGGDSGKGSANTGSRGRPELAAIFYTPQTVPTGVNGNPGLGSVPGYNYGNYYGGGGGGGGGIIGGNGGNLGGKGGEGGGNGSATDGSINYTTRTVGDNAGNGYIIVSWG